MDDISEKLAGILNDPESMERVRKMAESFLGTQEKEEEERQEQNSPFYDIGKMFGADELQAIMMIISKLKNSGNDPRTQLLKALKPHLSEPKREKVDTAIKILKVLEILPLMKNSGILNF